MWSVHLLKTSQKYCACHTKRLLTRYETCWNVTKCHACHAKRGHTTSETSKSDHSCTTRQRHGHTMGLSRSPADGCGRLRNVWRTHTRSGKNLRNLIHCPLSIGSTSLDDQQSLAFPKSPQVIIYSATKVTKMFISEAKFGKI